MNLIQRIKAPTPPLARFFRALGFIMVVFAFSLSIVPTETKPEGTEYFPYYFFVIGVAIALVASLAVDFKAIDQRAEAFTSNLINNKPDGRL